MALLDIPPEFHRLVLKSAAQMMLWGTDPSVAKAIKFCTVWACVTGYIEYCNMSSASSVQIENGATIFNPVNVDDASGHVVLLFEDFC